MSNNTKTEEIEAEIGRQLRDLRLRQNIDQRRLAERAGVALNAVKNLESGRGATLTSLVKVEAGLNWCSLPVEVPPDQKLLVMS